MSKKIISLLLAILMLLTLFNSVMVSAAETPKVGYYYVAPGGTGDGRTKETPAKSISMLMPNVIADGYGKGDEVVIYVSGGEGSTTAPSSTAYSFSGGSIVATEAHITVTSLTDTPAILGYGTNNPGIHLFPYGDTTYENIILLDGMDDYNGIYNVTTIGYDVTFGENVYFRKGKASATMVENKPVIYAGRHYFGERNADKTVATITINNTTGTKNYSLAFGGNGGDNTIAYDQTFVVNGGSVENLYLHNNNNVSTYSGNINLVLNGATLKRAVADNSNKGFTVNGAIQVVANNGATLPDMSAIKTYADNNNVPYYVLSSVSGAVGALYVTDTVGAYEVESDKTYAYAYDKENQPNIIYYGNDTLVVNEDGEYVVGYTNNLAEITADLGDDWRVNNNGTITRGAKTGYYYVAPGGTGDGRTKDTPAKSISVLMPNVIEDGYGEGDEVIIYVSGGEGSTTVPSKVAYNYNDGKMVSTKAHITITSLTDTPAILGYGINSPGIHLFPFGNTTYENIILLDELDNYNGSYNVTTIGYDVTFGENVYFKKGKASTKMAENKPVIYAGRHYFGERNADKTDATVTINNTTGIKNYSLAFGGNGGDNTIAYDQTFVVNGGNIENLYLHNNNNVSTYSGNINLVLNGATLKKVVADNSNKGFNVGGAIQVIANNGATFPDMSSVTAYANTKNVPCYVLSAISGATGTLTTTKTAGTYTIDSTNTYACAYSTSQPDTIYYGTNTLTVGAAGAYSVGYLDDLANVSYVIPGNWIDNGDGTMTLYPDGVKVGRYYVAPSGTGDGRTKDTPAKAISKVIDAINTDGYGEGDYVTIYVSGGEGSTTVPADLAYNYEGWPTGNRYVKAHITITSMPNEKGPAVLGFGKNGTNSMHLFVWGDTTFKNIILLDKGNGNFKVSTLGYNVTFEEDVYFKNGSTTMNNYAPVIVAGKYYYGEKNTKSGVVTINNSANTKSFSLAYGSFADATMSYDQTFVVNGGSIENLYMHFSNSASTYSGDVNLILNGTTLKKVILDNESKGFTVNGAIQVVANNGATLPDMSAIKTYADTNNVPYYMLYSDVSGILANTGVAGTYKTESDKTYAYAYDANQTNIIYYGTDTLTVKTSGNYKVGYTDDLTVVTSELGGRWADNGDGTITLMTAYEITVDGGNADMNSAYEGDTVTVSALIPDGYAFAKWVVVSGNVALSDETAEVATFKMVGEAVELKAEFIRLEVEGDITGDYVLDANDLVALRTNLLTETDYNENYDINGDGIINILDLIRLKKMVSGINTKGISISDGELTVNENVDIGKAVVDSDAVVASGTAVVTINGGIYNGGHGANNTAVWAKENATVIINDGKFTVGADANGNYNDLIYARDNATVVINGGFFESTTPWSANGKYYVLNVRNDSSATITVYGGTFVNYNPADGDDVVENAIVIANGYTVISETQENGDVWYTVVAAE